MLPSLGTAVLPSEASPAALGKSFSARSLGCHCVEDMLNELDLGSSSVDFLCQNLLSARGSQILDVDLLGIVRWLSDQCICHLLGLYTWAWSACTGTVLDHNDWPNHFHTSWYLRATHGQYRNLTQLTFKKRNRQWIPCQQWHLIV